MRVFGDYHTHTTYSHGTGTVLDSALAAKQKNLKEIAITDHGFGHSLYSIKRVDVAKTKEDIISAEKETGIKILFGVEANFISSKGDIDVSQDDLKNLDILLAGFHRFVKSSFKDKLFWYLPNILKFKNKKLREKNTNAVISALKKYPIDILVHPKYGFAMDIKKLIPVLKETKTIIEINCNKNILSDEEILLLAENKIKMILNSDAHSPQRIGDANLGMNIIERLNIPHDLIVNLDKVPNFKNVKNRKA